MTSGYTHSMGDDGVEWVRNHTGIADLGTDPFPELQDDEQKADWIRWRMTQQRTADPNAPTILDAIDTARRITAAHDAEFWAIINR